MKKTMLVLGLLSLTGCGRAWIKKEDLNKGLTDVNTALQSVQTAICTPTGQEKIDQANLLVNNLIDQYTK